MKSIDIREGLSRLIHRLRPDLSIPDALPDLWWLYRSLVNETMPNSVDDAFLCLQDETLQMVKNQRDITDASKLPVVSLDERISLFQGDITTLAVDAIVNAANEELLGCFIPCHACIDNVIHTFAGTRLRKACEALMEAQGHDEPVGSAKLTKGYNLPCSYVLHTVGPRVRGMLTERECAQLAACYESCLQLAAAHHVDTIAFCCISTGVYRFPKPEAAKIAVQTVLRYLHAYPKSVQKVVFTVYEEIDYRLYHELLGGN